MSYLCSVLKTKVIALPRSGRGEVRFRQHADRILRPQRHRPRGTTIWIDTCIQYGCIGKREIFSLAASGTKRVLGPRKGDKIQKRYKKAITRNVFQIFKNQIFFTKFSGILYVFFLVVISNSSGVNMFFLVSRGPPRPSPRKAVRESMSIEREALKGRIPITLRRDWRDTLPMRMRRTLVSRPRAKSLPHVVKVGRLGKRTPGKPVRRCESAHVWTLVSWGVETTRSKSVVWRRECCGGDGGGCASVCGLLLLLAVTMAVSAAATRAVVTVI